MSLCFITSRQVEALCRWDRPIRQIEPAKEPIAVVPKRALGGPSLNCDDMPEAGFGGRKYRQKQVSRKHQPCRFAAVVEEQEEDGEEEKNDGELLPMVFQWSCASCTFLNDGQVSECEMCGRCRETCDGHVVQDGVTQEVTIPESEKISGAAQKWPSLQQSLQQKEKSWEWCEQSSLASSIVDVAILRDVEDSPTAFELLAYKQCSPADCYEIFSNTGSRCYDIFSDRGSQFAGEEGSDTASMASWWHADAAETAKDVGNLTDIEGHPENAGCMQSSSVSSWLKVSQKPDAMVNASSSLQDADQSSGTNGANTWSRLVSSSGNAGKVLPPKCSGVPVPPLTRSQAPRKKAAAPHIEEDDEYHYGTDDQDARGQPRASRRYRGRR